VRPVADHVVHRTVPPVDGSVVQAQFAQLGRVAAGQHLDRVLVVAERQQCREVRDVLLEEVEHRGDPPLAEPHPRPYPLSLDLLGSRVGGLLEERDARFPPQLPAHEER
jgi:hypothetical protein